MMLHLSRVRLRRDADLAALAPLLDPAAPVPEAALDSRERGRRLDAHHRLIWSLFADNPDRRRDFLWRAEGGGRFTLLSARPPAQSALFEPVETRPFAPDLAVGDSLAFALRANATRTFEISTASVGGRPRKAHRDVVMLALHNLPREARAAKRMQFAQEAGAAWLEGQGARAGFDHTQIPVGGLACVMLEPGARISHAAVALAARAGTLVVWVGEGGVRLYSAGRPGGARADRLLWQARIALDDAARLRVVRKMYAMRFGEAAPSRRSIDQLRGIEGVRVRESYALLARQYGVTWRRRAYDVADWEGADVPNRCLSAATACLHGLSEAAILAVGYATAIGFLHTGKPLSFVYDIADLFKLKTVVPEAFRIAGQHAKGHCEMPPERAVRLACRDAFRRTRVLEQIIPAISEVLEAGDLPRPDPPPEALGPAFPVLPDPER